MTVDRPIMSRAEFLKIAAGAGIAFAAAGLPAHAASRNMRTRAIPKSGERLPIVGVGTARNFDVGSSPAERAPFREIMKILFEAGGTVIDTSPMYGRAETVIGDLLTGLRAHPGSFVATKVWTRGRQSGVDQMNDSLRLLRTRRIDLMQVHNLVDWRTQLKTVRAWKEEGRVRYLGITHWTRESLDRLADIVAAEQLDFVQLPYALSMRAAENRLLPLCAERGVATVVNRPFVRGALFRRVNGKKLPPWAAEFDCASWAQFFLKFILGHPAVTCVIPGAGKPWHMRDNAGAGHGRLPTADQRRRILAHWRDL